MSTDAPTWYVEQWKDGVIHKYQSKGFTLKNCTTAPVRITGEKMHFLIAGTGEAEEEVQRGDIATPMNAARTKVEVDTKKSRAFDEVYEDDLDQMNVDERQVVHETSAMALGRVHDKTIIRALNTAVQTVGGLTTKLSLGTILQAAQKLQANDLDWASGDIFCAVDSINWNILLTYDQFNNADYVGPDLPYVKGGLAKTWNGIHFMQVSDAVLREQNSANQSTCLMWHKSAIGFGYTRELTGTVQWDNRKDCWTHNMRMRIGSKLLLPEGVVKVLAKYVASDISIA